jgi:hypothetical protein
MIFMGLGILYKGFISYNPSLQISFLSLTITNIYSECVNIVRLPFKSICYHSHNFLVKLHFYTNSTWQIPFWKTDNFSVIQTISWILRKPKVHYRYHNSPPILPFLVQIYPAHTLRTYFFLISYTHRHLGLPSRFFPLRLSAETLHEFVFFPNAWHILCPSHLAWVNYSNHNREYKSPNSLSLFAVNPSILGPNVPWRPSFRTLRPVIPYECFSCFSKFYKSDCLLRNACTSAWNISVTAGRILVKFHIGCGGGGRGDL